MTVTLNQKTNQALLALNNRQDARMIRKAITETLEDVAVATRDASGNVTGLVVGGEEFSETNNFAYVDFTDKPDGDPPSTMDSGHPVDYIFNAGFRQPVILNGRLVVDDQAGAGSGSLADYYQANIGSPVTRVGIEFTLPSGSDDGNGNVTYAAWDGNYEGGGTNPPKAWVHMSIIPGTGTTGTAKHFVCNGTGNLFVVKQQTFRNPTADGATPWFCESILDVDAGMAYSFLPDGSLMTVSNAEIAAACTALTIDVFDFSDLAANWIMVEHYANTGASAAKYAEVKAMFGETESSELKLFKSRTVSRRALASIMASIPPSPVSVVYAPTTALSAATTTSAANVEGTNVKITAKAGPTGKLAIVATAYYEWSANDVMFWRVAGTVSSSTRAAHVGVSGEKGVITQTLELSGLTPGQTVTETLQHWSVSAGSATCKAGGSGGSMVPPVTLLAIPA